VDISLITDIGKVNLKENVKIIGANNNELIHIGKIDLELKFNDY